MLILCDQYPGNVFIGSAKSLMFDMFDGKANAIAKKIGVLPSLYKQYNYLERQYILLPLMHSGNKVDHAACLLKFQKIVANLTTSVADDNTKTFTASLKVALLHMKVVNMF